jgi:hypothetical protein
MKKIYLFILVVLLCPVTSSFAALPITETVQQIFIPYSQVGEGWWSGLVIHNTSSSSMTFRPYAYGENGALHSGSTVSVAAHAMDVKLLEGFFGGTAPSLRMAVQIRSTTNVPFQATLFVGNDTGGFSFQNYTSADYTYPVLVPMSDPVD